MGAQLETCELSALLDATKHPSKNLLSEPATSLSRVDLPATIEAADDVSGTLAQLPTGLPAEQSEHSVVEANQLAEVNKDADLQPSDVQAPREDKEMSPPESLSKEREVQPSTTDLPVGIKEDAQLRRQQVQVPVGADGTSPSGVAFRKPEAQPTNTDSPAEATNDPSRILFQRETELPLEGSQSSGITMEQPITIEQPAEGASTQQKPETSAPKRPRRDVECESCKEQQAKYRCPGCGVQTCSLECSKAHKRQSGCKGQRVKTAMVAIGEFDENNLISDYNFLEETMRQNEAARRLGRSFQAGPFFRHPPRLMQLISQAHNRRIELILLPADMSRRKDNTTYYDKRRKSFYWRVEWRFSSADLQLVSPKMDEHQSPLAALNALLEPRPGNAATRHKLRKYWALETDKLAFLLRKDCCKAPEPVYIKLDPTKRLRSLLEGKTIIEFPVINLALPSELERYSIVEDPVDPSEGAWESSSGRDAQSEGSRQPFDPRAHSHHEADRVGIRSEACEKEADKDGPPEEAPIVRSRGLHKGEAQESGLKQEGSEEFPLELAALLGEAAMADFHKKRKAPNLEPGEIVGD